jgi:Uncharacterized protein conserved in bacteria (DUF2188)
VMGRAVAGSRVHTVYRVGLWQNEVEGEGVDSSYPTKVEAVARGRELAIARRSEHVVHNLDGTIAGRNGYGVDPLRPVG